MNKLFERLTDCIYTIRNEYPEVESDRLYGNGKIVYANGEDGTDFDFVYNNRLCEFMIYHGKELNEKGFIKTTVCSDGTVRAYVYPNGEEKPVEKYERRLFDNLEVKEMSETLMKKADGMMLWDAYLDELNL